MLRSLIDRIVLTSSKDGESLTVDLIGDLAGILSIATNRDKRTIEYDLSEHQPVQESVETPRSPDGQDSTLAKQLAMVAGACNPLGLPFTARGIRTLQLTG